MKVCITGASGFIGSHILEGFVKLNYELIVLGRTAPPIHLGVTFIPFDFTDLSSLPYHHFEDCSVLIHLAAAQPSSTSFDFNVKSTSVLSELALRFKISRFIFLSSVKVNGETSPAGTLFTPTDVITTTDTYGKSKYEAEKILLRLASSSAIEVVIIRPPLVYGPGVKANFASMVSWVRKGVPFPFDLINNKRSLIAIDNLVDFVLLCADRSKSPLAANQTFLVSDGEDVSTSALLRRMANAYGVKPRLFSVPVGFLIFAFWLLGKKSVADRLFGNLQVDSSKARELLGWRPVVTMDEQLEKMAEFDKAAGQL